MIYWAILGVKIEPIDLLREMCIYYLRRSCIYYLWTPPDNPYLECVPDDFDYNWVRKRSLD